MTGVLEGVGGAGSARSAGEVSGAWPREERRPWLYQMMVNNGYIIMMVNGLLMIKNG